MRFIKKAFSIFKSILMWTLIASGAGLVIMTGYLMNRLYRETALFDLRTIVVKNNTILTPGEVIEISQVKRGARVMSIDTKRIIKNLNSSPQIRSSQVRIVYPATIVIEIKESKPAAMINVGGALKYVGRGGDILTGAKPGTGSDLPIINGEIDDDIIRFIDLALEISPFIYHQISEIVKTGKGLELYLIQNSANVVIGNGELEKKIVVLESFLKEEYGNLTFGRLEYIDLRFDKQVILKEFSIAKK